ELMGCVSDEDTIVVVVNPRLVPMVQLTADKNNIGLWTDIAFRGHAANGGGAPKFQWFVNGTETVGATDSMLSLTTGVDVQNNDTVCLTLISDELCAHPDTVVSNCIVVLINLGIDD